MATFTNLPDFDSLPPVAGMPQGCAWSVFDQDGKKDRLGCLNLLTPAVVQEAYREARDGVSVSLNWPLAALQTPFFSRQGLEHNVIPYHGAGISAFDDEVRFNTQCSSQWDSLVHFAHQPSGLNYNGVSTKPEQLAGPSGRRVEAEDSVPTLEHWHGRGGLVGRGVLVDYRAYAEAHGITYDCFDAHSITVDDLERVLEYQNTTLKHGDILIVRSGYTEDLSSKSGEEQDVALGTGKGVGVEGTVESARWFWNHHFAAVAGDAMMFESFPPKLSDGTYGGNPDLGEFLGPRCHLASLTAPGTDIACSAAPILPLPFRPQHRRALGLEGSQRALQETGALRVFAYKCAA